MRLEDINRLGIDIIQSAMEVDCVKESAEDGRCVPPLDTLVLSVTSRWDRTYELEVVERVHVMACSWSGRGDVDVVHHRIAHG